MKFPRYLRPLVEKTCKTYPYNNAKKGRFPVTKYPVHDRRRPNRSRGRSLYTYRESKVAPCRRVGKRFASGVAMERGKKERKGRKIIMNISINRVPSISNEIMHGGPSSALAYRFFKRSFTPSPLPLPVKLFPALITDGNETVEERVYAILCRYYFKYRNKTTNCTYCHEKKDNVNITRIVIFFNFNLIW